MNARAVRPVNWLTAALLAAVLALPGPVLADPPPWAPAHGWREKHYRHDNDRDRDGHDRDAFRIAPPPATVVLPYGLAQGVCNRQLVGAALGGAAGGLIGSQFGKSSGRTAAAVGGVLVGMFVGGAIGRSMDEVDQACAAQALEHVPDRRTVVWQGPRQQGYWITPLRSYEAGGRYCREYQTTAVIAGAPQNVFGTACRNADGSWQIVN
jgi:surface antigen